MTELEAFEAMYGKSYLRTKKPKEYAIVWEAWQAATKAEREACARVAENFDFNERPEIEPPRSLPRYVAQAIRERSNGQS